MSTQIQLDSSSGQNEVAVHVLPCHIAYDGSSKVSHHFQPRIDPTDETILTSSFRGRKLCGRTICLPKTYAGNNTFV
jgi:Ribonuclease H2 non-catalytic subunit (Ylr154p-like)